MKVTISCAEITYGEIEVEIPDNFTAEDLENAKAEAINNCEWTGKMEVSVLGASVDGKPFDLDQLSECASGESEVA